MSDQIENYTSPGMKNATLIYVFYLLSLLLPIISIVGLVFAYLSRGKADAATDTHYTFQIRTFWIGFFAGVLSVILMFVGIGFLMIVAIYIWLIIRCIKGIMASSKREPIPDPQTYLF